jgi:hypothetical protein
MWVTGGFCKIWFAKRIALIRQSRALGERATHYFFVFACLPPHDSPDVFLCLMASPHPTPPTAQPLPVVEVAPPPPPESFYSRRRSSPPPPPTDPNLDHWSCRHCWCPRRHAPPPARPRTQTHEEEERKRNELGHHRSCTSFSITKRYCHPV